MEPEAPPSGPCTTDSIYTQSVALCRAELLKIQFTFIFIQEVVRDANGPYLLSQIVLG